MNTILQDLRLAVRTLTKARGFTVVAVLTLAVALGANTAIFSVVNAVLLRPLEFSEPQNIVAISQHSILDGQNGDEISWPNIEDLDKQTKTLDVAGWFVASTFLMEGAEPERIRGTYASASFFPVLGVKPILGQPFTQLQDRDGAQPVILLSYDFWQRRFGGDPHIVGRSIHIGTAGKTRLVIGVMPSGFRFPVERERSDFYTSLQAAVDKKELQERGSVFIDVVGRIANGATLAQARAEVDALSKRLDQQYPASNRGIRFALTPLQERIVKSVRPPILMLLCAVGVVLLIGCANVANLLLARAAARQKEMSIRSAVGASRGRIVTQLLVESVLLSLVAGVCGLLLATWGVQVLVALAPAGTPRLDAITIDGRVLLFSLALAVCTGIAFGLAPALSASKTDLTEALKEGTRGSTEGRKRNRLRNALVVAEVALSVVLLVSAGLLLRSFLQVSGVNPGFDYRNAVVLELSARASAYSKDPQVVDFTNRVRRQLAAIPGVESVGATNMLPLGNSENIFTFTIAGRPPFPVGREPAVTTVSITPNYFRTMRIPLLRGRDFTDQDTATSPTVLIITNSFAKEYFPNEDPIGRTVEVSNGTKPATVVGIVDDVRFLDLTTSPKPIFYFSQGQEVAGHLNFVVRAPNAATLGPSLRKALHDLDPRQPVTDVRTLENMHAKSLAGRRFVLALIGLLAALALILASVGIYSIMSYTVTQRTSEIGIRMAIGAERRDIFRLVIGNALRLVGIGLVCGIVAALAATRIVETFLFGIHATDPLTFIAICLIIAFTAMLASFVPANRASRVDPLVAIRNE
jgi:putative ABC transport system permease protein